MINFNKSVFSTINNCIQTLRGLSHSYRSEDYE